MSWEHWIEREIGFANPYDKLMEQVCLDFNLTAKTRAWEVVDKRQFVCEWYYRNKWKFNRYRTLSRVAEVVGVKAHCGVIHLGNHRDVSKRLKDYEKNTKSLAKMLINY
jgi:hypothetical protein